MRHSSTAIAPVFALAIGLSLILWSSSRVTAQIAQIQQGTETPSPADPSKTIPEKMAPSPAPGTAGEGASSGVGETLSERLGRTDGVIRPPDDVAPGMSVPPPAPNPGTTRVIPPQGSPANPPPVVPK